MSDAPAPDPALVERVALAIRDASVERGTWAYISQAEAAITETLAALRESGRLVEWRPIEEAPRDGNILVATYAPTSWAYHVGTVRLHSEMATRHREMQLRYARAWMPYPVPPATAATEEH